MDKVPVSVRADHLSDGRVIPRVLRTQDGPSVRIDRVLDVRRAAALKAGGYGIRYTCRVMERIFYLFDDHGIWFIEK